MLLHTENLTKDYGTVRALDALDLEVAPGEVVGLLGPNGSGKTTALRLALGFLRPTLGRALIAGHDCWADSVAARRHVAYLPGELRLYENMTGRQIVHFLGRLRQRLPGGELDELARLFDIDLDRPLASLSSGMKRKVALLTVLAPRAPLLIMDEPTNALDPTMRDLLLDQVRRCRDRGQAVLFSSHVLSEVEQVCDRVAILRRGRLVHLQTRADMLQGRLIEARLANGAAGSRDTPPVLGSMLPGLTERARHGDRLLLEYSGPLPPLLEWLAHQPLEDLRLEPLGLAAVYSRYHGLDAATSDSHV
jgi:ABC-2 type transport system ATP-binding protein